MTPDAISQELRRITEALGGLRQGQDDIRDGLSRVEEQARITNGRVTQLEKVNAERRGHDKAVAEAAEDDQQETAAHVTRRSALITAVVAALVSAAASAVVLALHL